MNQLLAGEFLGNELRLWLLALGVAALTTGILAGALGMARRRITTWAGRTGNGYDDLIAAVMQATQRWFIAGLALVAGAQVLTLPEALHLAMRRGTSLLVIVQAGAWLSAAIHGWFTHYLATRRRADPAAATTAAIAGFIARGALWLVVVLVVFDNLGVNVTALVASLGIGGVAVALALQNVLGDLFASLAIALDQPFAIGDFIVVGDVMGTVERIGLRTTRLRSLSGELVVLNNGDLLASRIRNYQRMVERRVQFRFGVTPRTPSATLARIPRLVRDIVSADRLARFERAHFASFGESAFEFEVVYHVCDPDFTRYMDLQQRINLALIDALAAERVEFACPTMAIRIADSGGTQS